MSRELTRWEQDRDEYEASMLQHADDLGIFRAEQAKSTVEICDVHGRWVSTRLLDECVKCLDDDAAERAARREQFDRPSLPHRKPDAA